MKKENFRNGFLAIILLFSATFSLTGCTDTEEGVNAQKSTITVLAQSQPQLSTLVTALVRAGLDDDLNAAGTFTVFAPTNAAFTAFLATTTYPTVNDVPVPLLKEILLNHVLSEVKDAAALPNSGYLKTLGKGSASATNTLSLYVKKTTTGSTTVVELNGVSEVTTANVLASNGIVHIVDAVIGLPTIVTHATANDDFDSLVGALTGAGQPNFVSILNGTGPFTVFAPTNSAFTSLNTELAPGGIAGVSTANLTKVLQYHVVSPANVLAANLTEGQIVTPILTPAQTFTIQLAGGAKIKDANNRISPITQTDIQCANGVIHVLGSKVLLPVL